MKHIKKYLVMGMLFGVNTVIHSMEIGRHDGGDYAYWVPGSKDGKIYPTPEQKKNLVDTYYEQGDQHRDYQQVESMDFSKMRAMFPVFDQKVNGYPLIYLDTASSAQMPQMVLDEIVAYYDSFKSNVGRGIYAFSTQATDMFEKTRSKVAHFIGAKKHEIVFTQGTTAGLNLVMHAWAQQHIHAGDEIIISEIEHNANFLPWQQIALQKRAVLKIVPVRDHGPCGGCLDLEAFEKTLSNKTKLVAVTHQSNVLGVGNDVETICKLAHRVGAKVVVDAAQSIVHQKIDVAKLDCDFLAFSAHKLYGPTGIGALFIKESLFDQITISSFGGGMVLSAGLESSEFKQMPHCLEAGTQPIAQVIGLGAAIDFMQRYVNFKLVQEYETELVTKFRDRLSKIPGITFVTPELCEGEHSNMVVFISDDIHAHDLAAKLDAYGIAVRSGYHCVHLYHQKLGNHASVRVSFAMYNTLEEVDFVADRIQELVLSARN